MDELAYLDELSTEDIEVLRELSGDDITLLTELKDTSESDLELIARMNQTVNSAEEKFEKRMQAIRSENLSSQVESVVPEEVGSYTNYDELVNKYYRLQGRIESNLKREYSYCGPVSGEDPTEGYRLLKNIFTERLLKKHAPDHEKISKFGFIRRKNKERVRDFKTHVRKLEELVHLTGADMTQAIARSQRAEIFDDVTGLHNLRYANAQLEREIERADRAMDTNPGPEKSNYVSYLMIDIDGLKALNSRYRHIGGDDAIIATANAITTGRRIIETAAHRSGDEFIVILPQTDRDGAIKVAEGIARCVERDATVEFRNKYTDFNGRLKVTIGVATYKSDSNDSQELIDHANKALTFQKINQRGTIHAYDSSKEATYKFMTTDTDDIFERIIPTLTQDLQDDHDLIKDLKDRVRANYGLFEKLREAYDPGDTTESYKRIFEIIKDTNSNVADHCQRVSTVLELMGEYLTDINPRLIDKYAQAALLHDIGKIILDPKDLNGGEFDLGSEKSRRVRQGHAILSEFVCDYLGIGEENKDKPIRNGIVYHHDYKEGYPHKDPMLSESGKTVGAADEFDLQQIITMVDWFSAATENRPYQAQESYNEVIGNIEKSTKFEDRYVSALKKVVQNKGDQLNDLFAPMLENLSE